MFKKTEKNIQRIIREVITENPEFLRNVINENINLFILENDVFFREQVAEALKDKELLKIVGKELDKAEAIRISENRKRNLEELSEKEVEMEKSSEPWVDVMSNGYDPENGIALRLAWNSAFIKYLKENGITGNTEEEMVQRWLALVNTDILVNDM